MGHLLLLLYSLCLLWIFYRDGRERIGVSSAVWIVIAWAAIYGSRPVTEWFGGASSSPVSMSSYDEGNQTEALVTFTMILAGVSVLLRRDLRLSVVIQNNVWLVVFYLFWVMSISWSDYPLITFKRLFKDLGNVVMVLVVLTERNSLEAIKAIYTRTAYVLIPLSVLLIRYFPDWGRFYGGYDRSEVMWVGVATHKNTLGALSLMGALFLLWDILDRRGKVRSATFVAPTVVLVMCWYLLAIANSVTSLICAVFGSALLVALGISSVRRRVGIVEVCGLGFVVLMLLLDFGFDLNVKELLLLAVGRDATLTTRTDIWPILISLQDSPLVGSGFNTFWAGQRLKLLSEKVGGIIQAHNGYLETYLNGGAIGVGLLVVVLVSAYWRSRRQLILESKDSRIKFIVLLIAIFYNFSEASFNKVGILWLVTLFALIQYPMQPTRR